MQNNHDIIQLLADNIIPDASRITLSMYDDHFSDEYLISDVSVYDPPPPRDTAARGCSNPADNSTYFTKSPICRMKCSVADVSILDATTSKMLGPETDFSGVYVNIKTDTVALRLLANIINSAHIQPESSAHLGLVIVDVIDAITGKNISSDDLLKLVNSTTS